MATLTAPTTSVTTTAAAVDTPEPIAPTASAEGESGDVAKDGAVTDVEKKMKRAERFGVTVQLSEEEKRNTRAQRFGAAPTTKVSNATKNAEDQKRKSRAERFGLGNGQSVSTYTDEEIKKKARLTRFGDAPKSNQVEEDKKKARALRFSQPPSVSKPEVNGNETQNERKTVAAGKAGEET